MPNDTDENNDYAKIGYQAVYTLLPLAETDFEAVSNQDQMGSMWLDGVHDGWLMYIQALYEYTGHFNSSITKVFACEIVYQMMGRNFTGMSQTPRIAPL